MTDCVGPSPFRSENRIQEAFERAAEENHVLRGQLDRLNSDYQWACDAMHLADAVVADIWAVAREYLPEAIGYNTLPEIMRGIARQRDNQHEIKDHLAWRARLLTEERDSLREGFGKERTQQ